MNGRICDIPCPNCGNRQLALDIGVSLALDTEAVHENGIFRVDKPVMILDEGIYETRVYCNACGHDDINLEEIK